MNPEYFLPRESLGADGGISRGAREEIPPLKSTAAVIVRTSPNSHKHIGMERLIQSAGLKHIAVGCATPNHIPEESFNDWTARPDIVAALKVLQLSSDKEAMVRGILGQEVAKGFSNSLIFSVASDVMLDTRPEKGKGWVVHNKPSEESSREEIFDGLCRALIPDVALTVVANGGYIESRVRVGEAALCLQKERGVAGTIETFLWFAPYTEEQLALYVFGRKEALEKGYSGVEEEYQRLLESGDVYQEELGLLKEGLSAEELRKTNLGWRWQHPIGRANLLAVGGVARDHPAFYEEREAFLKRVRGTPGERLKLLADAERFALAGSLGDLTGDVRKAKCSFPEIGLAGNWCAWHPPQVKASDLRI